MANKQIHKPGEKAQTSGQYGVVSSTGKPLGKEVTVTRNEPFPPTQKPGQGFTLNDKTKHAPDKK